MQPVITARAIIALGSNMASRFGPPDKTVLHATNQISGLLGAITGKSSLYITPCFPADAGPNFVNAVICVKTSLKATKILETLHTIEANFGRERLVRWGQRTLDLDLLCLEQTVLPDLQTQATWRQLPPDQQAKQAPAELILPHPRLQDRAFVLVPMAEIAPDWVHPLLGKTVVQMRDALPSDDIDQVVKLTDPQK